MILRLITVNVEGASGESHSGRRRWLKGHMLLREREKGRIEIVVVSHAAITMD